jgi:NADH-quinone oxidoreductase subunit F
MPSPLPAGAGVNGAASGNTAPMPLVHRVNAPSPVSTLDDHVRRHGGRGLETARALTPAQIVDIVDASGLRGRGGGGFPTGRKWRTVASLASPALATTVVVNAAEGEPGTFKDRHLLHVDPWSVLEGALIAARAVGAAEVVVAMKRVGHELASRVQRAVDDVVAAGWTDGVDVRVVLGPDEYLFGEETALLEVVDGRLPFPRLAPPWRRGVHEEVDGELGERTDSGQSARVGLAGATDTAPALVNNVETFANVGHVIARGAEWYRTEGTDATPGTFVCTVTGSTVHAAVGEVLAGTTIREVLDLVGGGARPGRSIKAALSGTANRVVTSDLLDLPVTYEDLQPLGVGPGSAGFMVFDDADDMVAVAAGVARFLAIESCGQCSPCKVDGLGIADVLERLCANEATERDVQRLQARLTTVTEGARCNLASQQQAAVTSILEEFADEVDGHLHGELPAAAPFLVCELVDVRDGVATWDEHHRTKQPDWTHDDVWAGASPQERYSDHRRPDHLDLVEADQERADAERAEAKRR